MKTKASMHACNTPPPPKYPVTHPAILTFTLRLWRTCWICSKDPVSSWDLFNI